jgi:hypothetical protein
MASDFLKELDRDNAADRALKAIANGKGQPLTADQAKRILRHVAWLSKERRELFDALPYDD